MNRTEAAHILLDTHYWIWIQDDSTVRLPATLRAAITEAAARGLLLLSIISVWEVGVLESKSRLTLGLPIEEWVRQALATPGLSVAPLTPEIALDSSRLPGSFHGDPADRIIVATARRMHARLLTRDRHIQDYARQNHVHTV